MAHSLPARRTADRGQQETESMAEMRQELQRLIEAEDNDNLMLRDVAEEFMSGQWRDGVQQ